MAGIVHHTQVNTGTYPPDSSQVTSSVWDETHDITGDVDFQSHNITNLTNINSIAVTDFARLSQTNAFVKQITISPTTTSDIILNLPTIPVGSASEFIGGISIPSSTIAFATTQETGDYVTNKIGQATLTNPAIGTIPNASSLKIVGSPIASTNVTITNAYALWVAAGTTKLDGAITAAGALTSTGGITMSSADITLGSNNLKTTSYGFFESGVQLFWQPTATNTAGRFYFLPSGTSVNNRLQVFRTSSTSNESIIIGSDVWVSNELAIVAHPNSGTARPLNIYQNSTKLLSFDTANTITSYVDFNIGGNKLKTTNFNYYETSVAGQFSNFIVPSSATGGVFSIGTGATEIGGFQIVATTDFTTNYSALRIDNGITAGNTWTIGSIKGGTGTARPIVFAIGGTSILTLSVGIQVGAPTGGDKGAGTANFAGDIYKNNSAYTNPDYVFEKFYTGNIVKFASNEGAKDYKGLRTLKDLEEYVSKNHRFPNIPSESMGMFARGDKMLEISEELALYLFDHERRLNKLECKP